MLWYDIINVNIDIDDKKECRELGWDEEKNEEKVIERKTKVRNVEMKRWDSALFASEGS